MNEFKNALRCRPMRPTMIHTIVFSHLLILLSVWPVWGATYYMRADGKAANKAAATSCSSASTAMSVAAHNAEAFSPDDVICLCDDGGDYKKSIISPSSGTNGHPIIYKNTDGDTPTIDLSVDVGGSSGWTNMGGGVYRKSGFARVLWEDDVPLKAATSTTCSDGNWYYPIASNLIYYQPTSGTPANHTIRTMWFDSDLSPYGLDLRNKSNITVYGLNFNRCGAGVGHGQNISSPISIIKNIILHGNTITRCLWGIWSQLVSNGVESDVFIYNNHINYCNSGISAWTGSDKTLGHTQHHTRYSITGNKILNLYSISDTKVWSDALLTSYYYTDHEGISFQDVKDSIISNNIITNTFVKEMTSDEYWNRAIYFYLTNGDTATSGNSVLRNYISGHFYPSIYISTAKDFKGFENNVIAYNVLYYGLSSKNHISFGLNSASDNPLTGVNYFINNTIYNRTAGVGISIGNKMNGTWVIRNNIVKSSKVANISANNNTGRLAFDHNIYQAAKWGFQVDTSGMEFTTWEKTYKYDTVGSRVADPLFVSPGSDFHLQSGSPAIDAGLSVGLLKDYAGVPISGNPDIGAYEFHRSLKSPNSPTDLKLIK